MHALPGADAEEPRTWWTLANVIDCPDLELTLPTRTAIMQTPFTAEFVDEATRIIYRAIAAADGRGSATRSGRERPRPASRSRPTLTTSLGAAEAQTLTWAAKEFGTLSRYWEIESGLRGYRWYDDLPCIIGVNVHMRRGTETHTSTRKTRRYGKHPFRGAIDEIEIELLVKRAG